MKINVEEAFGGLVIWQGADQVFIPSESVGMIFQSVATGGYMEIDTVNAPPVVSPDLRTYLIRGQIRGYDDFCCVMMNDEGLSDLMAWIAYRIANYRTGLPPTVRDSFFPLC